MIRAILTRVLAETIEVDGLRYQAELATPRERWSLVMHHKSSLEVIGHADNETTAKAQAERLNAQLTEFVAGHDGAAVLQ